MDLGPKYHYYYIKKHCFLSPWTLRERKNLQSPSRAGSVNERGMMFSSSTTSGVNLTGCRVYGLGLRAWGLGFRAWALGFGVGFGA